MAAGKIHQLLLFVAVGVATGCSDSNEDTVTGEGSLRTLHAIPELGRVQFLIEETLLASVDFKQASGISEFDDLEYEFNFDTLLPGDSEATRIASLDLSVDAETEYTFVLAGSFEAPEIVLWQQFGRDWQQELDDAEDDDTEVTAIEVSFGHVSTRAQALDIFLEPPGMSPLAATPKATLAERDFQTAIELQEGEYQLVMTPAGDPSTILFASDPIEIFAATSNLFVVLDDGGETTAEFSVRWIGTGLGTELLDLNLAAELSVYHSAFGTDDVDVVASNGLASPLVQGLSFGNESERVGIDEDVLNITVTPSGNPGVFLTQRQFAIQKGSYNRVFLVGLPGDMQAVRLGYDRRQVATLARVQFFQSAARFTTLDAYIVDKDTDITLIAPTYSSLLYGSGVDFNPFEPGEYIIVITESGTKNVIGGPIAADLTAGNNYLVVVADSENISAVDVVVETRPTD